MTVLAVQSRTYMLSSVDLAHSAWSVILAPPPFEKKNNAKLLPFSDAFGIYIADGTFSMKIQHTWSSLMLTQLFLL